MCIIYNIYDIYLYRFIPLSDTYLLNYFTIVRQFEIFVFIELNNKIHTF